jgi:hypothetical protein
MSTSTKQQSEISVSPTDALNNLLDVYTKAQSTPPNMRDMLMLALSTVNVAQRAFTGKTTLELQQAVAETLASLPALALSQIQFPIMSTLLSQTYTNVLAELGITDEDSKCRALLEALLAFLMLAQTNPEYATESTLRRIVEGTKPPVKKTVAYPELNYRANILKIFTPGAVTAVDLEPLQIVVYKGELLGGGFGPELWGLAYVKDEEAHVLLETGEYIKVPEVSLSLAITKDYSTSELPPYLLACAKLFVPIMFSAMYAHDLTPEIQQALEKLDKNFGSFTLAPALEAVPVSDIAACENVIDRARWGADDKKTAGAMKAFSVAKSCFQVVVNAQQAAVRPFINASLVIAATGTVVMRLDTPREFSAHGIYLFPLAEKSTALIVV